MDVCRPIGNIYHSKLAIAVDWIVFVDNTQTNGNNNIGGGGVGNGALISDRAMTPKSSGIAAGMISILMPMLRGPVCQSLHVLTGTFDKHVFTVSFLLESFLGLLHDSMVFRQEPSYSQYLTQWKENQLILEQNEVRKREQQAREDRMKGKSTSSEQERSSHSSTTGTFTCVLFCFICMEQ